jgi:lipid-A-disaccharide synthase
LNSPLKIALVAGEASGDLLAASLIKALKVRLPDIQCYGIAGPKMQEAGVEAWHDSEELSVFGLFEVLGHLRRLLRLRKKFIQRLLADPPDIFIGIDAPEFNLGLEKQLKAAGIKTVHYVSPSVWAWRQGRVKKIYRSVDRMLTLFPFEPAFYAAHGVDARYVGHPMADEIERCPDAKQARLQLGLDPEITTIALLPGSRSSEVSRLSDSFLQAAEVLSSRYDAIQFVTTQATETTRTHFVQKLSTYSDLDVVVSTASARLVLAACDVAIVASGTIALEALLVNRPMVVAYRVAIPTYILGRVFKLLKSEHFSLPNILAGERLVPELLQHEVTPSTLADTVSHWLNSPAESAALRIRFSAIHDQLQQDASNQAADAILDLIG